MANHSRRPEGLQPSRSRDDSSGTDAVYAAASAKTCVESEVVRDIGAGRSRSGRLAYIGRHHVLNDVLQLYGIGARIGDLCNPLVGGESHPVPKLCGFDKRPHGTDQGWKVARV